MAFTIAKFIANETDKNEKNKAKEHQENAESGCKRDSKFHDGLTYGMLTVCWPGWLIEIDPPHTQLSFELSCKAGMPPSFTVELPGDQGAGVSGMQGMGVRTPIAAAVAAATVGFAMD